MVATTMGNNPQGPLETTTASVVIEAIKKLNPGAKLLVDEGLLRTSVPIDQLKLPEPFYYNAKNGINNKHQTASGGYVCIRLHPDPIVEIGAVAERSESKSPLAQASMPSLSRARSALTLETTTASAVADAIRKLNPGVKAQLENGSLRTSVPIDQLKLPESFYYDGKNGITNKHTSASGSYVNIHPIVEISAVAERSRLETTTASVVVEAIKKLNPGVRAEFEEGLLRISVPIDQLKLPEPFYYNAKNGITNKHQTASGGYLSIKLHPDPIVDTNASTSGFSKLFDLIRDPLNAFRELFA